MFNLKIGFGDIVQVFLICLKLFGYVDWSWFAILLPVWISIGYVLGKDAN